MTKTDFLVSDQSCPKTDCHAETAQPIFTKFGGKVTHGPRKKPLDFGGNPDHDTLGLRLSGGTAVLCMVQYVLR